MANTTVICIEKGSATRITVIVGRILGWNEDTAGLYNLVKLNVNGTDISGDGSDFSYDETVAIPPYPSLTHFINFTVPSGTTSGILKYKDDANATEQSIAFSGVGSRTQIVSSTPGRYRLEYKNSSNLRLCPSGNNAVVQDTDTNSQVSHQINHLGNGVYQLQHVTTGLCLSSGGGAESAGQQCTYKASDVNDTTQKFTVKVWGNGGCIIRFVSNPAKTITVNNNNVVIADYSTGSNNQSFLFQTIEDTTAVSGGSNTSINLVSTGHTDTTIDLDWNDVPGASVYNVFRTTDLNNWPTTPLFGQGNSILGNNGLSPNTTYSYRVAAVVGGVQQAYSNIVTVTTNATGGLVTTGTPTIDYNALGELWEWSEYLTGTATANSAVKVYNGTTLLFTTTAGSDGKWKIDFVSNKQKEHLPQTTQLNATAQLNGQNVSTPSANRTVTATPNTAELMAVYYKPVSPTVTEYSAEVVTKVGNSVALTGVQVGAIQYTLGDALNLIRTTFNT